jgi:hypothetical protein
MRLFLFRSAPISGISLLCAIALSGCCTVKRPINSPAWITPTHPIPQARECSRFDGQIDRQMRELKRKLESQRRCCGQDDQCMARLCALGAQAWDRSLATYELVHTDLPVEDKIENLKENQAIVDALQVCQPGVKK